MATMIQNWGLRARPVANPWGTPPELVPYDLVGEVDGKPVSSRVLRRNGQTFECEDGTSYELGEAHPEYNAHCDGRAKEIMLRSFNPSR